MWRIILVSKGIMGPELMEEFKKQAVRFGTEVVFGEVASVDLKKRVFQLAVGKILTRAIV